MKVLIVDDSPTEVHVYKTYLEKAGIDVVIADTAEDGIRAAQEEAPDVILMDVVMPGMNGFQATRQLSKEDGTASIPIVLLTTKGAETDKVWGMRQGATDYIVKPVKEADLVNRIKSAAQG
ncbi:MAG: twitching motility response regulator PilH [Pseudomonadota bacterium]